MTDAKEPTGLPVATVLEQFNYGVEAIRTLTGRLLLVASNPDLVHHATRKSPRIAEAEAMDDYKAVSAMTEKPMEVIGVLCRDLEDEKKHTGFAARLHEETIKVELHLRDVLAKAVKLPESVRARRGRDIAFCIHVLEVSFQYACQACGCTQTHMPDKKE